MEVTVGSRRLLLRLDKVLFSPNVPVNLVSEARARQCGVYFDNERDILYTRIDGRILTIASLVRHQNAPFFCDPSIPTAQGYSMASIDFNIMHRRLLHANPNIVRLAFDQSRVTLTGHFHNTISVDFATWQVWQCSWGWPVSVTPDEVQEVVN